MFLIAPRTTAPVAPREFHMTPPARPRVLPTKPSLNAVECLESRFQTLARTPMKAPIAAGFLVFRIESDRTEPDGPSSRVTLPTESAPLKPELTNSAR